MPDKFYWTCGCGRWTWITRASCIGCDARPPKWVSGVRRKQQQQPPQEQEQGDPRPTPEAPPRTQAHAADGSTPTGSLPLGAGVPQPAGGRRQARARKRAETLASAGTRDLPGDSAKRGAPAIPVPDDVETMDDAEECQHEDGITLATRLASAKDCVLQLETMGAAAQGIFPDCVERLAEARQHCDTLQRERPASRPVRWRLVEAERLAKNKAAAVEKAAAELHDLEQQLEDVEAKAAERRLGLARVEVERKQAEDAVAAVRDEIAQEVSPQRSDPDGRAAQLMESTAAVAQGIAQQVAVLPAALASNKAEAALVAIQVQTDALLAAVLQAQAGNPPVVGSRPSVGMASPGAAQHSRPASAEEEAAATQRDGEATPTAQEPTPAEATRRPTTRGPRSSLSTPPRRRTSVSLSRSAGHEGAPEASPHPGGFTPSGTLSDWIRPRPGAQQG